MKTPYETLRKLCYDTIYPDGIPLEFGCEVGDSGKDCQYVCEIVSGVIISVEHRNNWNYFTLMDGYVICEEDLSCCGKILGRPLSLQDLLRVIRKHELKINITAHYLYIEYTERAAPEVRKKRCDLKLNTPISEQPEEVLEKLIELIK